MMLLRERDYSIYGPQAMREKTGKGRKWRDGANGDRMAMAGPSQKTKRAGRPYFKMRWVFSFLTKMGITKSWRVRQNTNNKIDFHQILESFFPDGLKFDLFSMPEKYLHELPDGNFTDKFTTNEDSDLIFLSEYQSTNR